MSEQEVLFDLTPDEKFGKIEKTEIEYFQLAFSDIEKKEVLIMLESIVKKTHFDNYSDLIIELIRKKYEENKSQL
tara:strand:+ start:236 stop:460 length:225 start_codon:yes stop_codon:yes gene_type:complete